VGAPTLALVAISSFALWGSSGPASAGGVASARAHAHALYLELQAEGAQMSALGQQYDAATIKANELSNKITELKSSVRRDTRAEVRYQATLEKAAVNAYVNTGSVASTNPLFVSDANQIGASTVYNQVAEGNLAGSVAAFTNARQALSTQVRQLNTAEAAARSTASLLANERARGAALLASLTVQQRQADAAVRQQLAIQQAAAAAQAAQSFGLQTAPNQNFPAPPPNSKANIAVDTALSLLGKPYCWGGSGPSCYDCSGLTMTAWGAAGVSLPHFSGAQMADSTPVPVPPGNPTQFLEPGDLLFYGPGGSEHVAMYIGSGKMIEAPYTGAVVWITQARFWGGFAGAGRP
jgi:cell wall-associated NlpC family hydrolase